MPVIERLFLALISPSTGPHPTFLWWLVLPREPDGRLILTHLPDSSCGTQFTPHRLVTTRKYYYAGGQRIALRESGTLYYLFSDHLGSTGVSYRPSDLQTVRQLYKPWGEVSKQYYAKYGENGNFSNAQCVLIAHCRNKLLG
jgi:hypothetical protein